MHSEGRGKQEIFRSVQCQQHLFTTQAEHKASSAALRKFDKCLMHEYTRHNQISTSGVQENSKGGLFNQIDFNQIDAIDVYMCNKSFHEKR